MQTLDVPKTALQGIQRPNRPNSLPRPEKPLLPTIIVTPSSPSTHPTEFHTLVYAPPDSASSAAYGSHHPRSLFKPFATNARRLRWVAVLLALVGTMLLWHAWVLRSARLGRAGQGPATVWDAYLWHGLQVVAEKVGWVEVLEE